MAIICFCGHADKYNSTGISNKCIKCQECQYFRPRGNNVKSYSNKSILAKFDVICKVCKLKIVAEKSKIIRNSKNVWVHESCNNTNSQI